MKSMVPILLMAAAVVAVLVLAGHVTPAPAPRPRPEPPVCLTPGVYDLEWENQPYVLFLDKSGAYVSWQKKTNTPIVWYGYWSYNATTRTLTVRERPNLAPAGVGGGFTQWRAVFTSPTEARVRMGQSEGNNPAGVYFGSSAGCDVKIKVKREKPARAEQILVPPTERVEVTD